MYGRKQGEITFRPCERTNTFSRISLYTLNIHGYIHLLSDLPKEISFLTVDLLSFFRLITQAVISRNSLNALWNAGRLVVFRIEKTLLFELYRTYCLQQEIQIQSLTLENPLTGTIGQTSLTGKW